MIAGCLSKYPIWLAIEGYIVLITNVHEEAGEDDLHDRFADYGTIKQLHMNLDRRSGFAKGYGLIEYGTKDEAQQAIEHENGKLLCGKPIGVHWAFKTPPYVSILKHSELND